MSIKTNQSAALVAALADEPHGSMNKLSSLASLLRAAVQLPTRIADVGARHPRTLTGVLVAGLMGFGVTAFGIAPLAPDASDLPRRLVTEIVTAENIPSQLETLASHPIELYRSDLTRNADTADSLPVSYTHLTLPTNREV